MKLNSFRYVEAAVRKVFLLIVFSFWSFTGSCQIFKLLGEKTDSADFMRPRYKSSLSFDDPYGEGAFARQIGWSIQNDLKHLHLKSNWYLIHAEYTINKQGAIEKVKIIESPSNGVSKILVKTLSNMDGFKPAIYNGETMEYSTHFAALVYVEKVSQSTLDVAKRDAKIRMSHRFRDFKDINGFLKREPENERDLYYELGNVDIYPIFSMPRFQGMIIDQYVY